MIVAGFLIELVFCRCIRVEVMGFFSFHCVYIVLLEVDRCSTLLIEND